MGTQVSAREPDRGAVFADCSPEPKRRNMWFRKEAVQDNRFKSAYEYVQDLIEGLELSEEDNADQIVDNIFARVLFFIMTVPKDKFSTKDLIREYRFQMKKEGVEA